MSLLNFPGFTRCVLSKTSTQRETPAGSDSRKSHCDKNLLENSSGKSDDSVSKQSYEHEAEVNASKRKASSNDSEDGVKKKNKRNRGFVQAWKRGRPWLIDTEGAMFCEYCKKYAGKYSDKCGSFVVGCKSFRIDNLISHERSGQHKKCQETFDFEESKKCGESSQFEKAVLNMEKKEVERLQCLFNTAYYLAMAERPFTDFSNLIALQKKNGVVCGNTYANDKQAREFINCIADVLQKETATHIKNSQLFSLLCDSSTDKSVIEEEIIYVRIMVNNRPVTRYLSLQAVEGRPNARGILAALNQGLAEDARLPEQQWKDNIVGFGADGATVILGQRGGVAALIKRDVSYLQEIHCVAHKVELGIKDSAKAIQFMATVTEILLALYKFYHYSALNWNGLLRAGEACGIRILRPGNILGTRWIGHHERAVKSVQRNWPALVVHLQSVQEHGQSTDAKNRAKGMLKKLCSYRFLKFLNFLRDCFHILLSLAFQSNDSTTETVHTRVCSTRESLQDLQRNPGPHETTFADTVQVNENGQCVYRNGHVLTKGGNDENLFANDRRELLARLQRNIGQRFHTFQDNEMLASTAVLDHRNWPDDRERLREYGNDSLLIICNHFRPLLHRKECEIENIPEEWNDAKMYISQLKRADPSMTYLTLWQRVLQQEARFSNLQFVVKCVLLLPIHTVECERGFSVMKRIKSDWRAALSTQTLNQLMRIHICGVPMEAFDPEPAIQLWWQARHRRPHVQPYGRRHESDNNQTQENDDNARAWSSDDD